jgi:hypothetical protein
VSLNCGHQRAYCPSSRWYRSMESHDEMRLTGKSRRTRRKTCPSATLSTTNSAWNDPGANQGLRQQRSATNGLSHGTAFLHKLIFPQVVKNSHLLRSSKAYHVDKRQWTLSWAIMNTVHNHTQYLRTVLIFYSYLCLSSSCHFLSAFSD